MPRRNRFVNRRKHSASRSRKRNRNRAMLFPSAKVARQNRSAQAGQQVGSVLPERVISDHVTAGMFKSSSRKRNKVGWPTKSIDVSLKHPKFTLHSILNVTVGRRMSAWSNPAVFHLWIFQPQTRFGELAPSVPYRQITWAAKFQ